MNIIGAGMAGFQAGVAAAGGFPPNFAAGVTAAYAAMNGVDGLRQADGEAACTFPDAATTGLDNPVNAAIFQYINDILEDYIVVNGPESLLKFDKRGVDPTTMGKSSTMGGGGVPDSDLAPGKTGPIIEQTIEEFMYGWYDEVFKTLEPIAEPLLPPKPDREYDGFYGPRLTTVKEVKAEDGTGDLSRRYEYYTGQGRDPELYAYKSWRTIGSFLEFSDIIERIKPDDPRLEDNGGKYVGPKTCPAAADLLRVGLEADDCKVWLEEEVFDGTWYGQFEVWQEGKDPASTGSCEVAGEKKDFCFSIWVSQAMRNLEFYFQKKIKLKGIKMNQYAYNPDLLDRTKERNVKYRFGNSEGKDESANPYDADGTDPNFVVPMTHYAKGVPMYLSLPVLGLVADEERNKFTGLDDFDFDTHAPYLGVDPISGKGMMLRKRFQYNLKLEKNVLDSKAWTGLFTSLGKEEDGNDLDHDYVIWPMIWVTDGNEISDDDAKDYKFLVYDLRDIFDGAKYQGPILGAIFYLFAAWLIYFACTGRGCCCNCGSKSSSAQQTLDDI